MSGPVCALRRAPPTRQRLEMFVRSISTTCLHRSAHSSPVHHPAGLVSVGDVVVPLRSSVETARPEMCPAGYLDALPKSLRPALKWLAQKDALGQDALLLSSPAERMRARFLALAYAELVRSDVEYLAISQDTTESDLKQRRELLPGGNVGFTDSAPVRAATRGGMLVLDGIERAERNVLPTLNNLLENREMSLEDGRFLMTEERYDKIRATSPEDQTTRLNPVHRHFRVLALASPCPPFAGRSLDPPLRSRFQALLVPPVAGEEIEEALENLPKTVSKEVVQAATALMELERQALYRNSQKLFSFSPSSLIANSSRARSPEGPPSSRAILQSCYPPLLTGTLDKSTLAVLDKVLPRQREASEAGSSTLTGGFFETPALRKLKEDLKQDLAAGRNILLLGPKGSGKSALLRSLQVEQKALPWTVCALHRDLGPRDLLQRRVTDPLTGASGWADQPCVQAARDGGTLVLDGIHRLAPGVLVTALGRLAGERELDLPDGRRLVKETACQPSSESLSSSSRIGRIPESFRMVALAEQGDWITPEVAAMFSTYQLPEFSSVEIKEAFEKLFPGAPAELVTQISDLATSSLLSKTPDLRPSERASLELSFRTLKRLMARSLAGPEQRITKKLLEETMMAHYLPQKLQDIINSWVDMSLGTGRKKRFGASRQPQTSSKGNKEEDSNAKLLAQIDASNEELVFAGSRRLRRRNPVHPEMVPYPRHFFPSPAAQSAVSNLLLCELAGEHAVLVVGNQGVGKNVAVDRMLELIRAEREYVQLHRDTTVSSLTLVPVLEEGRLRYEEAPLVRAASSGRVCVLDEADKAPLEVVVVLKALVEDHELLLPDGRRLLGGLALARVREQFGEELPEDIIPVHDDFRLIVLANRPGFPFQGNSFFRECGDIFAPILLDNPDLESETALLLHCAPTYPHREVLHNLARAFAELRRLAEQGSITYPYSMREAVAIARHLEKFPTTTVAEAVANVFAFEAFDAPLRRTLAEVLDRVGFRSIGKQLEVAFGSVAGIGEQSGSLITGSLDIKYLPKTFDGGFSKPKTGLDAPKHGKVDPTGAPHVGGNTWAGGSGGSDTAGLGGRGGPYRLWDGNPVHQVSEEAKNEVSEEAKQQARALAEAAWRERLENIEKMDDDMWKMYNGVLSNVESHVAAMENILRQAQDKKTERKWLRNRSDGELDDARLVEGVAGDRLVFKKRGKAEVPDHQNQNDARQDHGKRRLCFVMDCSGSMYRFNGLDGRLNRMLEATCLIMEAMDKHLDRFEYCILGHSGDTAQAEFVNFGEHPATRGERLKVLQRMLAHTQFCWPGDHTIEATNAAIDHVLDGLPTSNGKDDDDDDDGVSSSARAFVVVVSDANFRRYRMDPLWWSEALTREPQVECHAVMLGSLGNEAQLIQGSLPSGRGHIVMETSLLPGVFRSIFEQAGLCPEHS